MINAIDHFAYVEDELSKSKLKLLLNLEDLNNRCFIEVFKILKPHQKEQYAIFQKSGEAQAYRKERNEKLPYVDFNHLPEVLDDIILEKIMHYQKDGEIREAVYDLLSQGHKGQIARFDWNIYEEEKTRKRALMTDEEKRKEQEAKDNVDSAPHFQGNMGEPDTVEGYIAKYGVDPRTGKAPGKSDK